MKIKLYNCTGIWKLWESVEKNIKWYKTCMENVEEKTPILYIVALYIDCDIDIIVSWMVFM